MPDGEAGSLRMTYAQLAEARGISRASAERLVRNRKWPRVLGNDGVAIVIVPPGEASPGSSPGAFPGSGGGKPGGRIRPGRRPRNPPPDHGGDPPPDFRGMIDAAVAPIREQLERAEQEAARLRAELVDIRISEQASANLAEYGTAQAVDLRKRLEAAEQRADHAEKRADEERTRAERVEQQLTALQAELVELRASERAAAALAEHVTGDATDLRNRLDAAEQRASEEHDRADRGEKQLTAVEAELVTLRVEAAGLRCQIEQARPKPPRTRWRRFLRALGH